MVGFGCDNAELGKQIPPFMLGMTDDLDHKLRIAVGASVVGEPAGKVELEEWPESIQENVKRSEKLQEMISSMRDVWGSTEDVWEIDVDGYVLLMERNESYTTLDDYAIERGMWLMVFERSCLLDDLSHYTFANDRYPGKLAHYGVYCEDHLIDIVTDAIPIVRKLTAEEIHAWGIEDKDDSMV